MSKLCWFLLVVLIVADIFLGVSAYRFQEQVHSNRELQEHVKALENVLDQANKFITEQQIVIESYNNSLRVLQAEVDILSTELKEAKKYGGLIEFSSREELMEWLYQNPVSDREYRIPSYVCSDFARDLVLDAISAGYLMGLSRISDEHHQKAFTIIGKDIYEIEAINDGVSLVGTIY